MTRRLRWESPQTPLPRRPYRDSAIVYGVLAVVGFGFLLLSGRGALVAFVVMGAFFVAAVGWSWWRFRALQGNRPR